MKVKLNPRLAFGGLPDLIEDAISFLREHEPHEGYLVGFSGGKDSIVTKRLVVMSGVKHEAVYSCTGIDPPEVVKFIRQNYPEVRFAFPVMTFWHGIMKKSPPGVFHRWCCDILKKQPTIKDLPHRVTGIRREESTKRAKYPRVNRFSKPRRWIHYYPILDWNEADIWEFIEGQGLAYPSLYDEGFDRLGCVVCPFRGEKQHALWRARWPGIYHTFEVVVSRWWQMKQAQGHDMRHDNPQEYLGAWYRKDFKAFGKDPTPEEIEKRDAEWELEEELAY